MSRLDIHGCVDVVLAHFIGEIPEAKRGRLYALNRELQYRLCATWMRFERSGKSLSERECVLLAEAWLIANPNYMLPIHEVPT